MKEIGLKDYELCAWDGYVVPKGAPKELKDQLPGAGKVQKRPKGH